jgi:hypothetical protein
MASKTTLSTMFLKLEAFHKLIDKGDNLLSLLDSAPGTTAKPHQGTLTPIVREAEPTALYAELSPVSDPPCMYSIQKAKRLVQKSCDLSPQDVFAPSFSRNRWWRKYYRGPCLNPVDVKAKLQDALVAPSILNRNSSKFRVASRNVPPEESVNPDGINIGKLT